MKNYLDEKPYPSGIRRELENRFLSFALEYFPECEREENLLPFIVRSKIHHTLDVCRIGEYIMENDPCWKKSGQREKFIGYCICLAHDLSRFPQYRNFHTLRDAVSFDHGNKSRDILLKKEFVIPELSGGELQKVCRAIEVHNKKEIPENYPPEELFYAQLVRDADKLSIIKVVTEHFLRPEEERSKDVELNVPDLPGCTEEVLDMALAGKGVPYTAIRCVNDFKIIVFQWPGDLNSSAAALYALKENLFGTFASFLPEHPKMPLLVDMTMKNLRLLAEKNKGGSWHFLK